MIEQTFKCRRSYLFGDRHKRYLEEPTKWKVASWSLAVGKKNFSFCKSCFRSLQLEEAHVSEINHDIHLVNTLFQIKVRQKKYGCRL